VSRPGRRPADPRREAGQFVGRRRFLSLVAASAATVTGPAVLGAAALGTTVTGCTAGDGAAGDGADGADGRDPSRGQAAAPAWLLTRRALAQVTADEAVVAGLARTRVYELVQPGQPPLARAGALPAVSFSSAAALAEAVRRGLPAHTQAVLYDPEAWAFTPAAEQRDPVGATALAARSAQSAGVQLIVAPALNLTSVLAPGSRASRSELFLELGLAASMGRYADVLELQAQSLERDTGGYAAFVTAAAAQARAVRPQLGLLAGVSTNPPGPQVAAGQVVAAIRAVRSVADGFWLNVPGPGPRCPTCNPIRPDIAVEALLAFV
jgi:hypothetical protein